MVSGAKAEMQENPAPLLDTEGLSRGISDTVETILSLGILALTIFGIGKAPKTPVMVVVNNYLTNVPK